MDIAFKMMKCIGLYDMYIICVHCRNNVHIYLFCTAEQLLFLSISFSAEWEGDTFSTPANHQGDSEQNRYTGIYNSVQHSC